MSLEKIPTLVQCIYALGKAAEVFHLKLGSSAESVSETS